MNPKKSHKKCTVIRKKTKKPRKILTKDEFIDFICDSLVSSEFSIKYRYLKDIHIESTDNHVEGYVISTFHYPDNQKIVYKESFTTSEPEGYFLSKNKLGSCCKLNINFTVVNLTPCPEDSYNFTDEQIFDIINTYLLSEYGP